jgi:DNA mismatch repair protein MutS
MLAEKLPRVRNLRVGVKEAASGIVFLHTIEARRGQQELWY